MKSKKIKLKDLYEYRKRNPNVDLFVKSYDGNVIRPLKMKDVLYSGKKRLSRVTLNNKNYIDCTSSHKIQTKDRGMVKRKDLKKGDKIMVSGKTSKPCFSRVKSIEKLKTKDVYDIEMFEHPNFIANNILVHNSGKSVAGIILCSYMDKSFNLDRIVFDTHSLKHAMMTTKPGGAILFDESFNGLSSRQSLSRNNADLVNIFQQCRQRNLFVIIVLPSIFMLDRYMSQHRTVGLIHTHIGKNGRHMFFVFNRANKLKLLLEGKKTMSYGKTINQNSDIYCCSFTNNYCGIDEEKYRAKKLKHFELLGETEGFRDETNGMKLRNDIIFKVLYKKLNYKSPEIANLFKECGVNLGISGIQHVIAGANKELKKQKFLREQREYKEMLEKEELKGGKK